MSNAISSKFDLQLTTAYMNAAGSLGFAPDARGPVDLERLGAFVTNPISLRKRTPARGPRFASYLGGFLVHSGYPNPGLRNVVRRYASRWSGAALPIVVHLLADNPDEVGRMVQRLENVEGVMALEVGIPPRTAPEAAAEMVSAAVGELPVITRIGLSEEMLFHSALAVREAGTWGVSLGPPRGSAVARYSDMISGRMYGPGVFPLALEAVRTISEAGVPVIGAGGIYSQADVEAMLSAGAFAVQLDSLLWSGKAWL